MEFAECFPIWPRLTPAEQKSLSGSVVCQTVKKGAILQNQNEECTGLLLVRSGQLRAYIVSDEGREITVYRLLDMDLCLFSASCMLRSVLFELTIEAEKDTEFWLIPAEVYKRLMEQSAPLANYTNEIMAARFSEVMWLMEQILWQSFDKRLAAFLLEEMSLEKTGALKTTHERIANHLGTAREVVTRMLRYFQSEGLVRLSRGMIEIADEAGVRALCGG
ncbi:MAG: Crp/Fnr family transcriptional regulator [Lachnospiraceae bacterium]|uniref:Crp/Fnr family transcriptional regulator n=1 Tax=Sporofaciens musculi TaxID=2681861 RepID=UPI00259CDA36|nr:Crp/Fnr family transcriptional regulator [Sporofaciens musculi]MCI8455372.1 Crp/Fnr family transcriptional regulator [Lachnospiraceae bacterium]